MRIQTPIRNGEHSYIAHYIRDREPFRTQLVYAIGCCVKPANRAPGGKASLVIGSRKNVSNLERNVLLFSRPFCRENSNLPTQSSNSSSNEYVHLMAYMAHMARVNYMNYMANMT